MLSTAGWIFLGSAAFAAYTLFGYPLIAGLRARLRAKPIRRGHMRPTVSVVLPVKNGARFLRDKLESIFALDYPQQLIQVIVIDDGSSDETGEIARSYAPRGVELIRTGGHGKAVALNAGIERARGEILFFTDVRQPLAPNSLSELVSAFADPEVGAASGELVILDGQTQTETSVGLYWKYEKWIRKQLSSVDSILGATGSIYAMRRALAVPVPPGALLDDMYQPLEAFFRGYRVVMIDSAKAFDYPTNIDAEFRRKVRTLAGNYQLMRQRPELFSPKANRMLFDYLSHKVARLLLPFALISALVSALYLPAPWRELALTPQLLIYGLAAIDRWLPDGFPLKRVSAPARTFVVLMAASACALSILFLPSTALWRETRVQQAKAA